MPIDRKKLLSMKIPEKKKDDRLRKQFKKWIDDEIGNVENAGDDEMFGKKQFKKDFEKQRIIGKIKQEVSRETPNARMRLLENWLNKSCKHECALCNDCLEELRRIVED